MKALDKSFQMKDPQLQATFTLVQISFKKTQAQSYAVEFNRGAQIYKMFGEVAWVHVQQKKYRYLTNESITVKIQTGAPLKYEWTVYKLTDDQLKEFHVSLAADITKEYNTLMEQLRKQIKRYNTLLSNIHSGNFQDKWTALREKLPFQHYGVKAVNIDKGVTIQYDLTFKCDLDIAIEDNNRLKLMRKNSRNSQKMLSDPPRSIIDDQSSNARNSGFVKSQPEMKNGIHPHKRRNQTLSDIIEASNENSSKTNLEDRNYKSYLMVNSITEEQSSTSSIIATKTHDFERNKEKLQTIDEIQRKRSNSLKQSNDDGSNKYVVFDDQLEEDKAAQTFQQTACPSINSKIVPDIAGAIEQIKPKSSTMLRNLVLILIIVLMLGAAISSQTLHLDNVVAFFKNFKRKGSLKNKNKDKKSSINSPTKAKEGLKNTKSWSFSWGSTQQDEDEDVPVVPSKKQNKLSKKKGKINI